MRMDDEIILKRLWGKNLHYSPPKTGFDLNAYYDVGIVKKDDLIDGAYYQGFCRNADVAKWDSDKGKFVYMRFKFGHSFPEDINHLSDDNGYDLFVPYNKLDDVDVKDDERIK
jgi:hypothetical protein